MEGKGDRRERDIKTKEREMRVRAELRGKG